MRNQTIKHHTLDTKKIKIKPTIQKINCAQIKNRNTTKRTKKPKTITINLNKKIYKNENTDNKKTSKKTH